MTHPIKTRLSAWMRKIEFRIRVSLQNMVVNIKPELSAFTDQDDRGARPGTAAEPFITQAAA